MTLPKQPHATSAGKCTVVDTKSNYTVQPFYNCRTCNLVGGYGACAVCIKVCHAGHDVGEARDVSSYCDCGWQHKDPGSYPANVCKCVDWTEATFADYKAAAEVLLAKYQPQLAATLQNSTTLIEVDWASFEHAAAPDRTWDYMLNNYYVYGWLCDVVASLVQDNSDARGKIGALTAIRLVHVNEGVDANECVTIDGTVALLRSSYCCYWHCWGYSDVKEGLIVGLDIWGGLKDTITAAAATASAEMGTVTMDTDWDSFDFTGDDMIKARRRKAQALMFAASSSGWYSWRKVTWARNYGYGGENPTDEELRNAFSSFVYHNKPYVAPKPDANGVVPYFKQIYSVKYDVGTKVMHIFDCCESGYWQCNGPCDIGSLLNQVVGLYRLGEFTTMTEAQHVAKMKIFESVCNSSDVRAGSFDWLTKLLTFPAFYPKDGHEQRAALNLLKYVNSPKYRESIPEDTLADEAALVASKGLAANAPEFTISYAFVTKINYKGMRQDRLVVVTDRATYTCLPRWKSSGKIDKLHRLSHIYYSYATVGALKYKTAGAPDIHAPAALESVGHAIGSVGSAIGSGAEAVAGAVGIDTNVLGFRGPPCGLRYVTTRAVRDDKPPKKFNIPNLKDKLLAALKEMIDKLKSISLPSMPKPSLPKFKVPDLLDMLSKCKPSMPHLHSAASAGPAEPTTGGAQTARSCATGQPAATEQDSIPAMKKALEGKDVPDVGFELPDLNPIHLLEKIVEKLEAAGEMIITLPSKLGLVGLLETFAKAAGKMTGLSGISFFPDVSAKAFVDKIGEALASVGELAVAGFSSVGALIARMAEAAARWTAPIWRPLTLGVKDILRRIANFFRSIELPSLNVDLKKFIPGMPKLPMPPMPKMPSLPGVKLPSLPKGPSEPTDLEFVVEPILPSKCSGASKFAALEVGWVICAAATAFNESWQTSPSWNDELHIETTVSSGIYNKGLRSVFRDGTSSKPSGEPEPITDDEIKAEIEADKAELNDSAKPAEAGPADA